MIKHLQSPNFPPTNKKEKNPRQEGSSSRHPPPPPRGSGADRIASFRSGCTHSVSVGRTAPAPIPDRSSYATAWLRPTVTTPTCLLGFPGPGALCGRTGSTQRQAGRWFAIEERVSAPPRLDLSGSLKLIRPRSYEQMAAGMARSCAIVGYLLCTSSLSMLPTAATMGATSRCGISEHLHGVTRVLEPTPRDSRPSSRAARSDQYILPQLHIHETHLADRAASKRSTRSQGGGGGGGGGRVFTDFTDSTASSPMLDERDGLT